MGNVEPLREEIRRLTEEIAKLRAEIEALRQRRLWPPGNGDGDD
jgi:prefoldin subunit 5